MFWPYLFILKGSLESQVSNTERCDPNSIRSLSLSDNRGQDKPKGQVLKTKNNNKKTLFLFCRERLQACFKDYFNPSEMHGTERKVRTVWPENCDNCFHMGIMGTMSLTRVQMASPLFSISVLLAVKKILFYWGHVLSISKRLELLLILTTANIYRAFIMCQALW